MCVGNSVWDTFTFGNFFQISTNLELIKDSRKTDLNELWSDMLIEILIVNPSKLHIGQEVLHGDTQRLNYDLGDIDTLTPQIKEDIEFQNGLVVKLNPGKFSFSLETESYSSI
jgi:hypothetical protein